MGTPHPERWTRHGPFLVAAALVVVAALGADAARSLLRFDRVGLEAGQWWRLVSAHFVHLGWSHTLLNLVGLALAALLFGPEYRGRDWLTIAVASMATISLGLWLLRPDLGWYVGLSGVLHGVYAAGALRWLLRREPEGYVLAVFLVAKLAWEQVHGALPLSVTTAGGPVVVDAHLAGTLGGLAAALVLGTRDLTGARR